MSVPRPEHGVEGGTLDGLESPGHMGSHNGAAQSPEGRMRLRPVVQDRTGWFWAWLIWAAHPC